MVGTVLWLNFLFWHACHRRACIPKSRRRTKRPAPTGARFFTTECTDKKAVLGKVVLVKLPGARSARYRWVVAVRPGGRLVARAPKVGVRVSHLDLKRDGDFGPPRALPVGTVVDA